MEFETIGYIFLAIAVSFGIGMIVGMMIRAGKRGGYDGSYLD